jgi:long-chain fatty acid transport protein
MLSFRIIVFAVCALFLSLSSQTVFASGSGGYRSETPDAGAMGEGSAFVGEADTPAAVYYNPAGINQMGTPEISIGDAFLAPRSQFRGDNGSTQNGRVNEYNVPNFYAVVPIIPNKLTIGVDGGTDWGLGENEAANGALRYATTQASLKNIDNSIVAAYQVTDRWSVAASADHDYSKADESKQYPNAFGGTTLGPDGGIELRGSDDSWGYRLATMFKINDQNQIGLMYRSRINLDYKGKITINGLNPALQAGSGFTGPNLITAAEEKSVLPQSVILGYSFKPIKKLTINADLEWMDWSSSKYQTLTYPNATPLQLGFLNSGGNPTAENWHSAWSESVGAQYEVTDHFRVRLGYYHHQTPIPSANFTPVIPDSSSNGYTTGFGFDINKHLTIDVVYSLGVYQTRDVTNATLTAENNINGKYSQYINIGLVSLTYKF